MARSAEQILEFVTQHAGKRHTPPDFDPACWCDPGCDSRVVGSLDVTDLVATNTFWVGCWPGLTEAHLAHTVSTLRSFHSGAAKRAA